MAAFCERFYRFGLIVSYIDSDILFLILIRTDPRNDQIHPSYNIIRIDSRTGPIRRGLKELKNGLVSTRLIRVLVTKQWFLC